jgi:ubiquinone/menaquinone biosynthesis C-methylase UbiE
MPISPEPSADRIMQMAWGFAVTNILATAVEFGVFTEIAEGATTPFAVAKKLGVPVRGIAMLTNALVAYGLIHRDGDESSAHRLSDDAAMFLVRGKPSYVGEFITLNARGPAEGWRRLDECVRTGNPHVQIDRPDDGQRLWTELVGPLFALNAPGARALGREMRAQLGAHAARIVDIACGAGVWGIGVLEENPEIVADFVDLPETLPITKRFAAERRLTERSAFIAGNIRALDLGTARYDLACLGHILHSEGADHSRRLLQKIARSLKPGGTIAIAEFLVDADRRGPVSGLVFAVNMLIHTTDGNTYSIAELSRWLEDAGFTHIRTLPIPGPSPLVLATKR